MEPTGIGTGVWTRRELLKYAAAAAWATPSLVQGLGGQRGQAIQQTGTELVLLGTQGGPGVTANRTQASNAVIVDGRPYIVDFGYGALKACVQARIAPGSI